LIFWNLIAPKELLSYEAKIQKLFVNGGEYLKQDFMDWEFSWEKWEKNFHFFGSNEFEFIKKIVTSMT
jgi:hypothetical protein